MEDITNLSLSSDSLKQAQWHGGLPSSLRLHAWLQQANLNDYNDNILGREKALMICYREVRSKCSEKEKEKCEHIIQNIKKEVSEYIASKKGRLISSELPQLLDNFENSIRDYADKHGLTNPDKQTIYDMEE